MELDGVEDVEMLEGDEGHIQITTVPEKVGTVAKQIVELIDSINLEKSSSEWIPNEDTSVKEGEGKEWDTLEDLLGLSRQILHAYCHILTALFVL